MDHIAVLGCGPAGLLAAHAAVRGGALVDIYSAPVKPSNIGGAQYLHRAIPGITRKEPDGWVDFNKIGTGERYANRVYGDPRARTSWDSYSGRQPVWNMRMAYARLWDIYKNSGIIEHPVDPAFVEELVGVYDHVIVAIPLPAVCRHPERHKFLSQEVWICQGLAVGVPPMTIVMNGSDDGDWYRKSSIFSIGSTEFAKPPSFVDECVKVTKPLRSTCDCWATNEQVHSVGRYGTWSKGVLIHDAYERVEQEIAAGWSGSPKIDGGVRMSGVRAEGSA